MIIFPGGDKNNDKTSLERSLEHSLFLVLKKENSWTLPMAFNENSESLRESAERALELHGIKGKIIGNAPFVHYKNTYSKKFQEFSGKAGEQIFIYKAFVQADQKSTETFHWLLKSELEEDLSDNVQFKGPLLKIIYDDED